MPMTMGGYGWEVEYAGTVPLRMYWVQRPVDPREKWCTYGGREHPPLAVIDTGRYWKCRACREVGDRLARPAGR